MQQPAPSISVVIPCFNESEAIPECHRRVSEVLQTLGTWYEIVYVDDGSRDTTLLKLQAIYASDPSVTVIELSRNFGHQTAVTAGLEVSQGEVVVIMDADLQDPPELIAKMVEIWGQGYEVVYGVRESAARRNGIQALDGQTFLWADQQAVGRGDSNGHRRFPASRSKGSGSDSENARAASLAARDVQLDWFSSIRSQIHSCGSPGGTYKVPVKKNGQSCAGWNRVLLHGSFTLCFRIGIRHSGTFFDRYYLCARGATVHSYMGRRLGDIVCRNALSGGCSNDQPWNCRRICGSHLFRNQAAAALPGAFRSSAAR